MPELPEVETVCAGLREHLASRQITDVIQRRDGARYPFPDGLADMVIGQEVRQVERRAKYILLTIGAHHFIGHLGMSGTLYVRPGNADIKPHDHLIFVLDNDTSLVYHDPRRFGFFIYNDADDPLAFPALAALGVEPLSDACNAIYLHDQLMRKTAPIKAVLLDQRIICGVGNIYACEALWRCGLHPTQPARECAPFSHEIVSHLRDVLREAIASGGSTLRDYANASGKSGYFQHHFSVYGKEGTPCERCGTEVSRIVQSGRSTFFCASCQPLRKN